MSDEEHYIAALSDPDNPPVSEAQLIRFRRISKAKFIRRRMGLTQDEFSQRFQIPLKTLQDWEQHRSVPDQAAQSYLIVIEREADAVVRALKAAAA